jgi:hypothetical protein
MPPYGILAREKLNHDTIMGWEKLTRSPGLSRRGFSIRTDILRRNSLELE